MFERILVPLDGSSHAERVLPALRRLSLRRAPELLLLRVAARAADAERYLDRIAARLARAGLRARTLVRSGAPAPVILRTAAEERATLLAVVTHGRKGLARLAKGSVAESLLRAAEIPVFVVPARAAVVPARVPIRLILAPVDGGPLSLHVVPYVRDLARPLDARVTLLHVNEPPGPFPHWLGAGPGVEDVEHGLREAIIPSALAERDGDPAAEILESVRSVAPDLLVMATHGRRGPARWLRGSVTESVLREAPVPLLVVPPRAPAEAPAP